MPRQSCVHRVLKCPWVAYVLELFGGGIALHALRSPLLSVSPSHIASRQRQESHGRRQQGTRWRHAPRRRFLRVVARGRHQRRREAPLLLVVGVRFGAFAVPCRSGGGGGRRRLSAACRRRAGFAFFALCPAAFEAVPTGSPRACAAFRRHSRHAWGEEPRRHVLERRVLVLLLVLLHVLLLLVLLLELLLLLKGRLVLVQAGPHHHGRQAVGVVGVGEPAGHVAAVAAHEPARHQEAAHGRSSLRGGGVPAPAPVGIVAGRRRRAPLLWGAANGVEGVFAALVEKRVLVRARERAPRREGEAVQVELPLKARDFRVAKVP